MSAVSDPGRIGRAVEGVRAHLSRSLAVAVAAWCGAAVLAMLVLAPALAGEDGWSAGSPGPLAIVLLIAASVPAGIWSWRRLGRRWCAEHRVARAMDRAGGLDGGATLGGLELLRSAPAGTSPGLRRLALEQLAVRLDGDSKLLAGNLGRRVGRRVRRGVTAFLAALAIALLVPALAPSRTFGAWDGLLRPLAVLAERALPPVSVEPGTVEVARGAVVEVLARAPLRDVVTLRREVTGRVSRAEAVTLAAGVGRASLPPVDAETRYWIETADGARSDVHVLTPVDPLFVSDFTIEVSHPPHTGLPPGEYRDEVPPLAVPAGTLLRVRGRGSRAIGAGTLLDEEGRAVLELSVRDARFEGSWVPSRPGTYAWRFSNAAGAEAAAFPGPLRLEVVADLPPEVAIVRPGADTVMPVGRRQPLVIRAADDHGIDRVEIAARRIGALGEAGEPVVHMVELGGSAEATVQRVLDASAWTLLPGDAIRYLARAVDNNPSPQVGESAEYELRIGGATDLGRAAEEELSRAAGGVEELAARARRAGEEARNPRSRGEAGRRRGGTAGDRSRIEYREEVARALERHERMTAAVDSLRRELARLREALGDAGLADPELRERLGELEKLLDRAVPEAGRRRLEALRGRLAGMDREDLGEALEKMAEEHERLRRRLEDSLEQFRSAALELDFRAVGEEARKLAEEQEILARAMTEGGDEPLRAAQQSGLEEEARTLRQRLDALRERLVEAGERQAGGGVREAALSLSRSRLQMRRAARLARRGRQEGAGREARQAAGDLSRVAERLDRERTRMRMRRTEDVRAALRRTAAGALALARRQSELGREMQGAGPSDLAALRGDEAAIAQGIRNLAENYAQGTRMAAPGARDLVAGIGRAMERLDATVAAMENPRARGPSPGAAAEQVVRALNEVARMAVSSGRQGRSRDSASASERMMRQLQQLAGQQGEIMRDAAALIPMRLGRETLEERVGKVAGRQERVAGGLDEMGREAAPLGDLPAFAEEARTLAEALARGRLDRDVLRRQERLFRRLLDAGRTLERDDGSDRRESERPGAFTREGAEALGPADVDALRFELPGPAALRALPPARRMLVIRYFERLNRNRGGGAGSGEG